MIENLQREATANSYKEELDEVLDDNDKQGHLLESAMDKLFDIKEELD